MSHVLIADDHPLFRAALKQAVGLSFPQSDIVEACDVNELFSQVKQYTDIEIVFLDLHMPGNDGFMSLTQLKNHYPDIEVIMVSADEQTELMQQAIDFGAAAFIPKSADLSSIQSAIERVLDGDTWLPIDACNDSPDQHSRVLLSQQLSELTPQQFKVLKLIAQGQLNKQIAYELDIKETTVKKHVSAILEKLQVHNRTLAGMAFQQLKLN